MDTAHTHTPTHPYTRTHTRAHTCTHTRTQRKTHTHTTGYNIPLIFVLEQIHVYTIPISQACAPEVNVVKRDL